MTGRERVVARVAAGETVRHLQAHLLGFYGLTVSSDLISRVTGAVRFQVSSRPARVYLRARKCQAPSLTTETVTSLAP